MIDNQLVSVDFLLKDRNLLIKYWNPEAIEALNATRRPPSEDLRELPTGMDAGRRPARAERRKDLHRESVGRADDRRRTRRLHEPRHSVGDPGPIRHVREEVMEDSRGWQTSPSSVLCLPSSYGLPGLGAR